MEFKFGSVTLDFEYIDPEEGSMGGCNFKLPLKACRTVMAYLEDGEVKDQIESDLVWREEDSDEDTVDWLDVDSMIVVLATLYENNLSARITCRYEHPIWLIHDLNHAFRDVENSEIMVGDAEELRAWEETVEFMERQGMEVPVHILVAANKEFVKRFGWDPALPRLVSRPVETEGVVEVKF